MAELFKEALGILNITIPKEWLPTMLVDPRRKELAKNALDRSKTLRLAKYAKHRQLN